MRVQLCTMSRNGMHHRNTLIKLHQCTKFGVDNSKLPETGGSLSNKDQRSWRAQLEPHMNGNHKGTNVGAVYMCPASLASVVTTVWPVEVAKEQQV